MRESEKEIALRVRQNSYQDSREADVRAVNAAEKAYGANKDFIIFQEHLGMTTTSVRKKALSSKFNNYDEIEGNTDAIVYTDNDQFPYFKNSLSLKPRIFIAGREGFLHQGLLLEHDQQIVIKDNLLVTSNLKYPIATNFEKLTIPPVNTYPEQVRSDNKKYLNAIDSGLT
ncbi:MAG: YjbH domain-containing protein, partial [Gammaproteobacteria bacterium]